MLFRKNKRKNIGLIYKIILIINILFAFSLLLSYLSPFTNPEKIWFLAFFGLAYYYLLLINLVFVVFWLIFKRKLALYSAIIILLGFPHLRTHFQYNGSYTIPEDQKYFSIMSYNVRLFDLYNWSENKTTRDAIIGFIAEENPDIICFQEYFDSDDDYFPVKKPLSEKIDASNVHEDFFFTKFNESMRFGLATYSRYPIVNKGNIYFSSSKRQGNYVIFSDILFNKDTIRVYNAHLASLHFSAEDYQFLENEMNDGEKIKSGARNIARKIKEAFKQRTQQMSTLLNHIESSPYPAVLCIDLNDTPLSFSYRKLRKSLTDSYLTSGKGIPNTYIGTLLHFRIDFIFHTDDFESHNFKTIKRKLSDHYPIRCDMLLKEDD
jgi:endonuclease/exonuclease/phosphatase family metal-dependent hydrolase